MLCTLSSGYWLIPSWTFSGSFWHFCMLPPQAVRKLTCHINVADVIFMHFVACDGLQVGERLTLSNSSAVNSLDLERKQNSQQNLNWFKRNFDSNSINIAAIIMKGIWSEKHQYQYFYNQVLLEKIQKAFYWALENDNLKFTHVKRNCQSIFLKMNWKRIPLELVEFHIFNLQKGSLLFFIRYKWTAIL